MSQLTKRITVQVKANTRGTPGVEMAPDGVFIVSVREPAIDGRANGAVIQLVADFFDLPKSMVQIVRGHTSRFKTLEIPDVDRR
jgi:uncharacterized protein YggU (UPF0235/DUF167 family)